MSTWQCDHLRKIDFVVGELSNLFEDFENIYLSNTMSVDGSKYRKIELYMSLQREPCVNICNQQEQVFHLIWFFLPMLVHLT